MTKARIKLKLERGPDDNYRVASIVGALSVYCGSREWLAGDWLNPEAARRLVNSQRYAVTVTPMKQG